MRRLSRRIRRLWQSVTEPRHMKAAFAVLYVITIGTGVATLLVPPTSIAGQLGAPLTVAWSVFLIMGGFGGLLTVFPGWWWAERLSIILVWTGLAIYGIVIVSLHFTSSGSRLTQLGVLMLSAGVGYVRWLMIRKYSFEPRG